MQPFCPICGNATEPALSRCPFCAAELTTLLVPRAEKPHKVVNIKKGLPTVEQALIRLDQALSQARQEKRRVVTLIHGYGSTGQGGVIREEVRTRLQYLQYQGQIRGLIFGEDFSSRHGPSRNLLRQFSFLQQHQDLNRGNPGITLVLL
jgi:hypothetical protein